MLTKLFGKKPDHPMADVKSAQVVLNGLPGNDALKSVMELTDWIETVAGFAELRLADQFAVLSLLDEAAQAHARKLAYEYFTLADMRAFQGNRLCQVLSNLSRQIACAYCMLFERHRSGDKGMTSISSALLAARAVRAMRKQLKYTAVRYEVNDSALWRNLAQLYRHAEQQQYLDTPVSLYPALSEAVSVRSEWVQLMAWYACGVNSMSPRSMHLAERIITLYRNTIAVSESLTGLSLFSFNLSRTDAPIRVNADATAHSLMRYISMADMQEKLKVLIQILEKNIVPQELNLDGAFTVDWVLEAARHVLTYLVSPPVRRSNRREFKGLLNVVTGCEKVFARCAGRENGEQMQISLENASASGFLAVLSGRGAGGVHIGHLLGMQSVAVPHWGVAIVRRLSRDAEGRLRVGAELLSNRVSEVMLRQSVADGYDNGRSALWLHAKSGSDTGIVRLLMQADRFSMQRSLKTCFEGKNYLLIPEALQEKGMDYDLASFRVIEQEESEG